MMINLLMRLFRPSDEAREARAKKAAERELRKQQLVEAQFYASMIPNALARLKIASISKKDKKTQINKVRVRPPVLIHEDYYMLEINTARLPYGVKVDNLRDPETLTTLSAACRTEIDVQFHPSEGFWYLVPRRGGLGIIPRIIDYDDCVELIPKSANIWAIPIGAGENRRLIWIDLRKTPHMMIIGSTGTGKTVFLKSMIFNLAMNCSPKRLRMVICDFKRGPDFKALADLPHLGTPLPIGHTERTIGFDEESGQMEKEKISDYADRILIHLEEIMSVLRWGRSEIDRRNGTFDEDVTDITRWNAKHRRNPLPHVLIIVDEMGVVMNRLKGKEKAEFVECLADIAMLGRSAGIHLVLGLQKVVKEYLPGAISDNIEARIVGFCASGSQSGMALGNGSWAANRIPAHIRGRAVWRDTGGELEIQLPWVSPKRAVELTTAINDRWADGQDEDTIAMDVFRWCLNHEGHYNVSDVYDHWKRHGLTRSQVQSIREEYLLDPDSDNPEPVFLVDEVEHVLLPHIPGQRPSKLVTLARYNEIINPTTETVPITIEPATPDVDPLMLFRYSLNELDGNFSYRAVYNAFRDEVSAHKIKAIAQEWEGKTFEIEGVTYELRPPTQVNRPRTIAPVGRESWNVSREPEATELKLGDMAIYGDLPENPETSPDKNIIAEQHRQPRRPASQADDDEPEELPDWLVKLPE